MSLDVNDECQRNTLHNSRVLDVANLAELLRQRRRLGEAIALIDPPDRNRITDGAPVRLSWEQVAARVDHLCLVLMDAGIGKGDVALCASPTVHETIVTQLACLRLGIVVAPVSVQYRDYELSLLIGLVSPKVLIGFSRLGKHNNGQMLRTLSASVPEKPIVLLFGKDASAGVLRVDLEEAAPLHPQARERLQVAEASVQNQPEDTAFILFTSGTEAAPKAVPRTHGNLLSLRHFLTELADLSNGACILSPRMLNTTGAITTGLVPWLQLGGRMVLHHPFDLSVFLQQIKDERPEYTSCPPALLNMMLQSEADGSPIDLSGLHHITSGSAQLNASVVTAFRERFGIQIVNVYGSSEGALLFASEKDVSDDELRAAYFPAFGTTRFQSCLDIGRDIKTRLCDPETGEEIVAAGLAGELQIQTPPLFEGYHGAPEKTTAAFSADGFYKTGDLFEYAEPDGTFLRFVGRLKNLIVRGGLNISAEEIENLLIDHPAVKEVTVVSRPDSKLGERVCAIVAPLPGCAVTLTALCRYLRDDRKIAIFKLPEFMVSVEDIPRTSGGKPDLQILRQLALSETIETTISPAR